MLKHCWLNVDYTRIHANQNLRPKCGEIFYENESERSFQLVCYLCGMKYFAFEDFVRHIRNVHFDSQGKPLTHTVTATQSASEANAEEEQCLNSPMAIADTSFDYEAEFLSEVENDTHDDDDNYDDSDEVEDNKPLRIIALKADKSAENESTPYKVWQEDEKDGTDNECEHEAANKLSSADKTNGVVSKKPRQLKEYNCAYCNRRYTTQRYLNMHLKMSHPNPKGFKCIDCDATFDVDRALETHRRKAHTEFTCKQCAKVYKSSRTLMRHLQGHSGLRQYKCDFENCGKSFVNQHNLASHRRVHSAERNYVCELCGYRSRYRDALVVHRRTHTGERPFKCQTCERSFASKSLLNEHQAMHSTERPYKCDKCEAAFSRPKALYHHKHLHLGIKKFKCKVCGNAYAQAAGLSAHMRGHKMQASNGVVDGGEIGGVELLFSF